MLHTSERRTFSTAFAIAGSGDESETGCGGLENSSADDMEARVSSTLAVRSSASAPLVWLVWCSSVGDTLSASSAMTQVVDVEWVLEMWLEAPSREKVGLRPRQVWKTIDVLVIDRRSARRLESMKRTERCSHGDWEGGGLLLGSACNMLTLPRHSSKL